MKKIFETINFLPKKFRNSFYVICIFLFCVSILELLSIALIIPIFNLVLEADLNAQHSILSGPLKKHLDNFFLLPKYKILIIVSFAYLFFYLIRSIFIFYVKKKEIVYSIYVHNYLQKTLIQGYVGFKKKIKLENTLSYYTEIITNQVSLYSNHLLSLFVLIVEMLTLLFFSIFLLIYNFKVTILSIIFFFLVFITFYLIYDKKIKKVGLLRNKAQKNIFESVSIISNFLLEIEIFGIKNKFENNFSQSLKENKIAHTTQQLLYVTPRLILELASLSLFVMIICIFTYLQRESDILIILAIYAFVILKSFPSISKIMNSLNQIKYLNVVTEQISKTLKDFEKNSENFSNRELVGKFSFKKQIDLVGLSIGYENENELIKDVNLKIIKNDFIGFQGTSGIGKSSLAYTILGILEPIKGKLILDENEINFTDRRWRNNIGYSPQFTKIFKGSLKENIAFGIESDEIDKDKLKKAIELSNLSEFVVKLESGVETIINEDATNISGGQRQRVGLARALYHQPEILILDEFTSSLDYKTELEILKSLEKLKDFITIILISHNESVIKICNKAYKIEDKSLKKIL